MCHAIPYQYYTKLIIQSLISCVVKWINEFSTKGGISKTMSPSMIVEGKLNTDFNQERIVFGSYAVVYTVTINDMNKISIPYIALNESNDHGGHYFMGLYNGNILNSYEWTEFYIDSDAIEQVKQLSSDEKVPLVKYKYLMF